MRRSDCVPCEALALEAQELLLSRRCRAPAICAKSCVCKCSADWSAAAPLVDGALLPLPETPRAVGVLAQAPQARLSDAPRCLLRRDLTPTCVAVAVIAALDARCARCHAPRDDVVHKSQLCRSESVSQPRAQCNDIMTDRSLANAHRQVSAL